MECPACGQQNPDGARFCNACAAPLVRAAAAAREERKVVTVFFADLVGFTGRAEQLDPEDVRAMLSPYYARLRSEIERFGGTVEKFIGDAVMAVFGAPVAHEDDPERAVRAGLAVRNAIQELNEENPALDLHVRIAVNTGEAVVALDARVAEGEGMVAGDVVNTAARLQTAAPVDGILVGETTYRATERVFEYTESAPVEAKGKSEPIPVWEAGDARARYGVDVQQGGGGELVGRREELNTLLDAFARMRRERTPQLLTLIGVPGIGKSRLVWELAKVIDADPDLLVFWRQGRSLPYGEGVAFWAVGEMVKAQAGILDTDSAESAEAKLHDAVWGLLADEPGARWVELHLRPLVGLSGEGMPSGEAREESFAACRRFFEAMAERQPMVLVFEDLHWADDNLLDFVDYLVDWATDSPLLVIGTARPELLERRPGWGGGKTNAATISLSPLSDEDIARLLAGMLDQPVMAAELQAPLLARAGGNPLYAEEYARMVSDRGIAPTDDYPVPETLQGILAARLDGLVADDKDLVQAAAVIGKVFWSGALADMTGTQRWTVEERLHGLERKQFVRRERRSSVASETEYVFRHVLVRDVAYGQIPRASRADKHRLAAEWIESLSADREDRAEMLAHHYLRALEFARAAGQDIGAISARALVALRDAGDRSYALSSLKAAADFYREALQICADDDPEKAHLLLAYGESLFWSDWTQADPRPLEEASRRLLAADSYAEAASAELMLYLLDWYRGERERATPHFERAAELVERAPRSPAKADVLTDMARFAMVDDQDARALELGRDALSMAEEFGLENIRPRVLNTLGVVRVRLGDREGLGDIERSTEATAVGSPERLRGFINLGTMLGDLGDLAGAGDMFAKALDEAERAGAAGPVRWLRAEVFFNEYLTGRWDEAFAHADEFLAEADTLDRHYMNAAAYWVRAPIRLGRADEAGGLADAERGLSLARQAQDPQVLYPSIAYQSHVFVETGSRSEGAALVDELLGLIGTNGIGVGGEWLVPFCFSAVGIGRGADVKPVLERATIATPWVRAARAYLAGDFEEAADTLGKIGAFPEESFVRLRAAEVLVEMGRRSEADGQLNRALAFYRSVGATRYIREAEALFAASA